MADSSIESRFQNSLLASLPGPELERLRPHLTPVALRRSQTLHGPGDPVKTIYFLEKGVCSVVSTMKDGNTVEVAMIGRDNFVGHPAVMGTGHSLNRSVIQIPGSGHSIKVAALERFWSEGSSELHRCLLRAIQGLWIQTAQTAACNRIHQIEERLSRWLLMCHDRVQTDSVLITHEFLAVMLGTRRSTVTVAVGILQKAGLIEHSRGAVVIINRKGLEQAACECYSIVHEEYVRLGLLER